MEHTEKACLLTRMNIARMISTNATLLVHVYKIFVRPNMDYSCTSLTARNKTQIHRLEVIQAQRVYSSCISNKELCSRCSERGTTYFCFSEQLAAIRQIC